MKRNTTRVLIVLLTILLIFGSLFFVVKIIDNKKNQEMIEYYENVENVNIDYANINGKDYLKKDNIETILFVGLDSYEREIVEDYTNDNFADYVTLLIVDKEEKTILPIQINRDTMCEMDILGIGGKLAGKDFKQLAFAHTYGSGDIESLINVKNAVSKIFYNLNIDYYISLTMNSVSRVNDAVGGVEVLVEDDFSGIDESLKMGENITLKGNQALTFVRTRSGLEDSSNVNRMKRQRVYLKALFDKCKENSENDKFIYDVLDGVGDSLMSNTSIYDLSDIGNKLLAYRLFDTVTLTGELKKGETFMECYLNQNDIDSICVRYLFDEIRKGE